VALAVEAMQNANKKTMAKAVIFSGDGDLIPLVDAIVREGISCTVVSFGNPEKSEVAKRLQDAADEYYHVGNTIIGNCFSSMFGRISSNAEHPNVLSSLPIICKRSYDFGEFDFLSMSETIVLSGSQLREDGKLNWKGFESIEEADAYLRIYQTVDT
jgi:hypothetical protein